MTTTPLNTKQVQVIARYEIKRNSHVVYLVRSSNGKDEYHTTLVNGRATGCSCPATKPCYHMRQLEQREAERSKARATEQANKVRTQAAAHEARLAEIEAWRRADEAAKDAQRHELAPLNGNRPFSILKI